ncbi:crfC [Symbiodinium sp. CCMP2592]|nr:crfC [Symbiodinium sp. CCMP2592]
MALMKSGKSTLLNAMIGQEFCPATVEPQTAALLRIQHDPDFPEGKLTDANGITIAEGREQILNTIMAANAERRNAVQQDMASPLHAAVQQDTPAVVPSPLLEGTYSTVAEVSKWRIVVSIHRLPYQPGLFVVVLSHFCNTRSCSPVQYLGLIRDAEKTSCVANVQCLPDGRNKRLELWLWFSHCGLDFQLQQVAPDGTNYVLIPRQSALLQEAPPRLLRARCTNGGLASCCSLTKGVKRRTDDCEEGYCEVGSEFVVRALFPRRGCSWLLMDHEGYWLELHSSTKQLQFQFLHGDHTAIVPGEQVLVRCDSRDHSATVVHVAWTGVKPLYTVRLSSSPENEPVRVDEVHLATEQLSATEDSRTSATWQAADDDSDELVKASMEFITSTNAFTLFVPVESFAACSGLDAAGLILMDTPGPNEAHVGLKMDLKVALAAADVVIYLIDYTKLGTKDEVELLTEICEECGDMLVKDPSRFWFVLNKVDARKAGENVDTIRRTVARKMSSLRNAVTVSARQILPISAQGAYLARQASNSRWEIDMGFRNEFEARAVGTASAEAFKPMFSEEEYWKFVQEKFPPALLAQSNFACFEEHVLVRVAQSKDRIMREKFCEAAQALLTSMQNSAKLTLATLQDAGVEIHQQRLKAVELSDGLHRRLQDMEGTIYSATPEEPFVRLIEDHFEKLKNQALTMIRSLFGGSRETTKGLKFWLDVVDKDKTWHAQVRQKFNNREDANSFVDREFEKFVEVLDKFFQTSNQEIVTQLNDASAQLQKDILQAAQPIINLVVKQAGDVLNLTLQEESLSFSDILTTDVEGLLEQGLTAGSGVQISVHKQQHQNVRLVTRTWYFLDHFLLCPQELERAWAERVKKLLYKMACCSKDGVQHLITAEVEKATGHVKERCAELSRILFANREQLLSDQAAAEAQKAQLEAQLKRIEATRKLVEGFRPPCAQEESDDLREEESSHDAPTVPPTSDGDGHPAFQDDSGVEAKEVSSSLPPLKPLCGQAGTTLTLEWTGPANPPFAVSLDGNFCSKSGKGLFNSPLLPETSATMDVELQMERGGAWITYAQAFKVNCSTRSQVEPSCGPTQEDAQIECTPTAMGAPVSAETKGGRTCSVGEDKDLPATKTQTTLPAPSGTSADAALVEMTACIANSTAKEDSFIADISMKFEHCGRNIARSADQTSVERSRGVTGGVCTGAPLQRNSAGGFEFTIRVDRTIPTGMRSFAVGFCRELPKLEPSGRVFTDDGADLPDSLLAGYDKRQAAAVIIDGQRQQTTLKWRPLQEIREQQLIHVQWTRLGSLIVSVDGEVKVDHAVSLPPNQVYPLVDIQGRVTAASFVIVRR